MVHYEELKECVHCGSGCEELACLHENPQIGEDYYCVVSRGPAAYTEPLAFILWNTKIKRVR